MIYVASPYSAAIPELIQQRYEQTFHFVLHQLREGHIVYSPVVYLHPLAVKGKLPTDAGFWMGFNLNMLRRSETLFLLQLPGWDKSQGVEVELNVCRTLDIPVVRFGPDFKLVQ